jgi:hypothetical protein
MYFAGENHSSVGEWFFISAYAKIDFISEQNNYISVTIISYELNQ